ncbi:hypothetical protein N7U66_18255 [Lacinutrix neustonica]|uniref:Calx-beta domain-containing protein n=1 Tax=Lacinutrix neustonica TaxID=2980107 RepID=A0A9E8SGJ9_9FLAO|nr:hypothetical protein [Lacinutrix neustonica]WAC01805.1 hypothetical protein N7U66_18255 [Lacinutrix neustonica]
MIQNGADAVAIYQGNPTDFPEGTLATETNLIDALVYSTDDAEDTTLMALLGVTEQISEGPGNNTNSIQRFDDSAGNISYTATTPTPRALNDGSGVALNGILITVSQTQYNEGAIFDITFSTEQNVTSDLNLNFILNNGGFNTSDFTGNTSVTIPTNQNISATTITLIDDTADEGDEELKINLPTVPSRLFTVK